MEHLDARLGTIAAMTPRCRTVADIGCDHGLLIAALLESGRWGLFSLYAGLSLVLCIAGAALGKAVG